LAHDFAGAEERTRGVAREVDRHLLIAADLPEASTTAGSATKALLSDAQHMLIVTGFSVAVRAVSLAAVHQELRVFFSVSSQVSWAQAGAEMAARQAATAARVSIVLIIGPFDSEERACAKAGRVALAATNV